MVVAPVCKSPTTQTRFNYVRPGKLWQTRNADILPENGISVVELSRHSPTKNQNKPNILVLARINVAILFCDVVELLWRIHFDSTFGMLFCSLRNDNINIATRTIRSRKMLCCLCVIHTHSTHNYNNP